MPNRIKSTDGDDTILVDSTWQFDVISIDGGGGINVIQGTFGNQFEFGARHFDPIFAPDVRNVQWALLSSNFTGAALDFSRWTGLTYVEAHGESPLFVQTQKTRFINIPLGVKQIGVANFNGIAVFEFAPSPPNSLPFHPADLFLDSNGIGGEIYINNASALHIHATGTNGPQILHADTTAMITVDGDGDVNLQHSSSLATTIDASAATGSCILSALSDRGVTITAGRGSHNEITTNGNSDKIDFLKNHLGRNRYILLNFSIPLVRARTRAH